MPQTGFFLSTATGPMLNWRPSPLAMQRLKQCFIALDVARVTMFWWPARQGGIDLAALQLAKYRGARVTALTSWAKAEAMRDLGANNVILRGKDILSIMSEESVDLVVDNVASEMFPLMLKLLRRGG